MFGEIGWDIQMPWEYLIILPIKNYGFIGPVIQRLASPFLEKD